mmetsp:Transcript_9388/g.10814  ORF Transcript_9388/g.10814 Transcript_9388/m.10814 type:complete len:145 (-) Transcript_9388:1040-1474(-)
MAKKKTNKAQKERRPSSLASEVQERKRKKTRSKKRGSAWKFIPVESRREKLKLDMVRPSILLQLGDENFMESFTALWEEHIDGFSGKKRERTEKEKNMEWRLRVKAKRCISDNGKKSKMTEKQKKNRLAAIRQYQQMKKKSRTR